jgi:glycosyltransferase involved in cell wall biosynthesis
LRIDVITPTLNSEQYLSSTLLSVDSANHQEIKHIIVDSGSNDGTREIVARHELELFYCPPGNMYEAINTGISETESEWVTYINSDDLLYSESLINAIVALDSDYDVIYGNTDYIDYNDRFMYRFRAPKPRYLGGLLGSRIMPFSQPGTIFRRTLWEKLAGFSEKYHYSSDFDFVLRAFVAGAKFGYFDCSSIAAFRIHEKQLSHKFKKRMLEEASIALMKSNHRVPSYSIFQAKINMRYRNIPIYVSRFHSYFSSSS